MLDLFAAIKAILQLTTTDQGRPEPVPDERHPGRRWNALSR
jgi:hypothetical protein